MRINKIDNSTPLKPLSQHDYKINKSTNIFEKQPAADTFSKQAVEENGNEKPGTTV